MYTEIVKCRICSNPNLSPIIHLGNQYLTGVFPKDNSEKITCGPLELVKCVEDRKGERCGLVQMKQSYDRNEIYGLNYGYRSGINQSMMDHLQGKVKAILKVVRLRKGDIVIDIGSNDSTLLQSYPKNGPLLCGIDPAGGKFKKYYPSHIDLIADFFSSKVFKERFGSRKAKIVTSIAMFYDIEAPLEFMKQIMEILDDEGVWMFEQSYMPAMLSENAYDTICHEHLEYYRLKQIKWMTDRVGLKIIDVQFNKTNGGSFSVMVAKAGSRYREKTALVNRILGQERRQRLHTLKPYEQFKRRVFRHAKELRAFVKKAKARRLKIFGYGASTKGNVILQFCQLTPQDIPLIADINQDKFGCQAPGTGIPIISEEQAVAMKPDYFLVLPWHFRDGILKREAAYLRSGGKMVFPLPNMEVVAE